LINIFKLFFPKNFSFPELFGKFPELFGKCEIFWENSTNNFEFYK